MLHNMARHRLQAKVKKRRTHVKHGAGTAQVADDSDSDDPHEPKARALGYSTDSDGGAPSPGRKDVLSEYELSRPGNFGHYEHEVQDPSDSSSEEEDDSGTVFLSSEAKRVSSQSLASPSDGNDSQRSLQARQKYNNMQHQQRASIKAKDSSSRKLVRKILRKTKLGTCWELMVMALSIISCVMYVIETYRVDLPYWGIEVGLTSVFTVDVALQFFSSPNRWLYFHDRYNICDIVTLVPLYLELMIQEDGSSSSLVSTIVLLRVVRVLRIMRIFRLFRMLRILHLTPVEYHFLESLLLDSMIVFICAGMYQVIENTASAHDHNHPHFGSKPRGLRDLEGGGGTPPPTPMPTEEEEETDFGTALYFIIVTISTVGYGDYSPVTPLGRFFLSVIIVSAIIFVPLQVNKLVDLFHLQSVWDRKRFRGKQRGKHVLLVGHAHMVSMYRTFLTEFFHPDRAINGEDALREVCIICPTEPPSGLARLLLSPVFNNQVTLLRGSVMSTHTLQRANARNASACFILADYFGETPWRRT